MARPHQAQLFLRKSFLRKSLWSKSFWSKSLLLAAGVSASAGGFLAATRAVAEPALVMDVASGEVLYEEQAADAWYPASLTKLMTLYVALSAVRDHKIALDTPLVVSARAASQAPSKMGFTPGTQVTLDNALKMLMVKSANDMAVTIAEGVSGSVEAFAQDMNATAAALGMRQSHFVNPNGLPDAAHVSSAGDLAQVARALYVNFPEFAGIYRIGALQLGDELIPTHNTLLGRYSGADGMKTGFTCSAGFNLVASAERSGHRYIAVVLGAPSVAQRMVKAAILLDRAFAGIDRPHEGFALFPQANRPAAAASTTAPDLRNLVCKRRSFAVARFQAQLATLQAPLATQSSSFVADNALFEPAANPALQANAMARKVMAAVPSFEPVPVNVGAPVGYAGLIAQARPPHSPVGTEPPPETTPPKPEVVAAPVKGPDLHGKPAADKRARRIAAHAKSSDEDDDTAPVKVRAKASAKAAHEVGKVAHNKPVKTAGKTTSKTNGKAVGDADAAHAKTKPAPHTQD
jgi:D-alanyl-D-alanine carboxypeptidase